MKPTLQGRSLADQKRATAQALLKVEMEVGMQLQAYVACL